MVLTSDFIRNESYFIPEMSELTLRFNPRTLRAKADNIKPLYVYGNVTITADGQSEQSVFNRNMSSYVRIDDPEQEVELGNNDTSEITLRRPKGMSMEDFLKMNVTIHAYFGHTNVPGTVNVFNLGETTSRCTVRELMMAAMRGTMNVFTQEKRSGQREANLVMNIDMNSGIRVISGSFSKN